MTETDPELDFLLAGLEHDEKFAKLGDNDQQAWLESLFFQDTTHLPGRVGPQDQLSQTNTNPKNTLRVNSSTNSRPEVERKNRRTDEETVTAVHVNDKMKNVAQDFFKDSRKEGSKKSSNQIAEKSDNAQDPDAYQQNSQNLKAGCQITDTIDASLHETSGVNEKLTSVVEAYFKKPQVSPEAEIICAEDQKNSDDDKTSLVASFFGPSDNNQSKPIQKVNKPKLPQANKPRMAPRKAVEVTVNDAYNPEEDDEIERLIRAAEEEQEHLKHQRIKVAQSPPTPPTPSR